MRRDYDDYRSVKDRGTEFTRDEKARKRYEFFRREKEKSESHARAIGLYQENTAERAIADLMRRGGSGTWQEREFMKYRIPALKAHLAKFSFDEEVVEVEGPVESDLEEADRLHQEAKERRKRVVNDL